MFLQDQSPDKRAKLIDALLERGEFADNLIVEVFTEMAGQQRPGKAVQQKRRISLCVLPALPFEIVRP